MPAFIDENQQFIDPDTSVPIVNGDVFFGEQGADPEALPIDVFAERALSTVITQPIKTDASGRTTQKIWIPGRYSFKVKNSAGSQKLIDLDAGSIAAVGVTSLTNINGANIITASSDPVLTVLTNGEQFTFTAAAINTGVVTLNIDGLGARPVRFNFNEEIAPGFFQKDQTINLTFNSTTNSFAWDNDGRGISLLTNVAGTANAITADGGPSVTGNVDLQGYLFKPSITNTGSATLKIGSLTERSIKSQGAELPPGALPVGVPALLSFNSTGDIFELLSFSMGLRAFTAFEVSGTWTRNLATKSALIFCIAGGGGGAPGVNTSFAGGGGGAGGTSIAFISSFTGSTDAVLIGGGGGASVAGGDSSVGPTLVLAKGGKGALAAAGGAGGLITGAVGTIKIQGGDGGNQTAQAQSFSRGGNGGSSFMGGGGKGGFTSAPGIIGKAFGSGGGGGGFATGTGSAGRGGIVFIIEFG